MTIEIWFVEFVNTYLMTIQINRNYLESTRMIMLRSVCEKVFSQDNLSLVREFYPINGQYSSPTFFCHKTNISKFGKVELEKLRVAPTLLQRCAVHESLTQFMNVLSRRIKVEKSNWKPLVPKRYLRRSN